MSLWMTMLLAQGDLNTLTAEEKAAGWKLLFDGKTTEGWRGYRQKTIPDGWKAIDGVLTRAAKASDIVTVDEYENFELSIEWKIASGGNSGIKYKVSEDTGGGAAIGPEYQVLDNAKHADGKNSTTSAGSAYLLYAPAKEVCKPAGEWNTAKILVNGTRVEHWLNGEKIVEFEIGSEDWQKKVAASKFKNMATYGKVAKGRIALQDHGDKVEFRNIKIRALAAK